MAERETVLVKAADEKTWTAYSCDPPMVRKITRIAKACGAELRDMGFGGVEADLPAKCVRIVGLPAPMSEERKAVARDRLAAHRLAREERLKSAVAKFVRSSGSPGYYAEQAFPAKRVGGDA